MIWIIASIPFWFCSLWLAFIGVGGLIYGYFSKKVSSDEFAKCAPGAFVFIIGSGLFAMIAAKLCS